MNKWLALPTWLLTRGLLPFMPKDHPWKGHAFTLEEWAHGQTKACRQFDHCFWVVGVLWAVIFLQLAGVLQ